jgi:RimJ/RimL family protein N-acetyltransferase
VPPLHAPDLADGIVRLRPWRADDAPALVAAWADPEIRRHAAVPEAADLEHARRWIAGEAQRTAAGVALDRVIELAAEPGAVAGEVGLGPIDWSRATAEVGFWMAEAHRGRGLAHRAVRLLADCVLGTGGRHMPASCPENARLRTLIARVAADNVASAAALAGAGFARRGRLGDGRELWARSSGSDPDRGSFRT